MSAPTFGSKKWISCMSLVSPPSVLIVLLGGACKRPSHLSQSCLPYEPEVVVLTGTLTEERRFGAPHYGENTSRENAALTYRAQHAKRRDNLANRMCSRVIGRSSAHISLSLDPTDVTNSKVGRKSDQEGEVGEKGPPGLPWEQLVLRAKVR